MLRALGALERGALTLTPQAADGVTYADKIDKTETRIDWRKPWQRGAQSYSRIVAVSRRVVRAAGRRRSGARQGAAHDRRRAARGAPGTLLDDKLTIACGEGAIRILELQRAGKQPMKADEFLRGVGAAPRGNAVRLKSCRATRS